MHYTVLIPNLISIILLLILLINMSYVSRKTMLLDEKIFVIMVVCNICQCLLEIATYAIDGKMITGFHALALFLNSLLFIINIIFSVLWVVYADYKIDEDVKLAKKRTIRLILPAIIIIILSIVNIFVPIFFRITEENVYERTVYFIIPYVITYFYLAYGTIFVYKNRRYAKKYVFLPAIVFMIPIIIGSVVQFLFYGFSVVWTGVALALVSVYLNIQNDVSYIDKLSGVYTRDYMYEYLNGLIGKRNSEKMIVGIMVDIDNFKKINDTYGHLVGDEAIRNTGKILHSSVQKSAISRYGGDEFVILTLVHNEEDIKSIIQRIENAENEFNSVSNKEYSLYFSKGYSIYDYDNDTVDTFIDRMDKAMYSAKKERKIVNK